MKLTINIWFDRVLIWSMKWTIDSQFVIIELILLIDPICKKLYWKSTFDILHISQTGFGIDELISFYKDFDLLRRDVLLTRLWLFIALILVAFQVFQLAASKTRTFMLSARHFNSEIFLYELFMSKWTSEFSCKLEMYIFFWWILKL